MRSYRENITVGSALDIRMAGALLLIKSSTAGAVLTVVLYKSGSEIARIADVGKRFRIWPVGGFDQLKISTSVNSEVEFIVTDGNIEIEFDDDGLYINNTDAQPVPVKTPAGVPLSVEQAAPVEVVNPAGQRLDVNIDGGTVNVTADNVGINNNDAAAVPVRAQALTALTHGAPVSVGLAAVAVAAADATRRKLYFRNTHASALVALGADGVTIAGAPILLQPGDIWEEKDAAGAAWYAISDTAGVDLAVMGVAL